MLGVNHPTTATIRENLAILPRAFVVRVASRREDVAVGVRVSVSEREASRSRSVSDRRRQGIAILSSTKVRKRKLS
ncbi:MAG: hypothetical protein ACYTXC_25675 [Nostoc sp.]